MCKSRFTDAQIIAVIKEHDAGVATKELCRKHGISANTLYKSRTLDAIAEVRGYPDVLVLDNGPENASLAMLRWFIDHGVRLHFTAGAERLCRELQRTVSRRMPQRARVSHA